RVVWTGARVLGTRRYRLGFAAKYALMNSSVPSLTRFLTYSPRLSAPTVPKAPVAFHVRPMVSMDGLRWRQMVWTSSTLTAKAYTPESDGSWGCSVLTVTYR